jgi:hypothetical protein
MDNKTALSGGGAGLDAARALPSALPEYLIDLPGDGWALWRCAGLRGAGFPASQALELSAPKSAEAADRLARMEKNAEQAHKIALEAVDHALAGIRSRGEWNESKTRESLLRALRRLKSGKLPQAPTSDAEVENAIESFRTASKEAESARWNFQFAYEEGVAKVSESIRGIVSAERFREAMIWQNRRAFNRVAESLSRTASRNSIQRRDEELVASYIQRYCVKNDTIGFFGPVGWATLVCEGEAIKALPGPDLIEARTVSLEAWGVQALAEKIAAHKEVLAWASPTRVPYVRVEGNALRLPLARPTMLTMKQASVLKACDGNRLAREIAASLRSDPSLAFKGDDEVYKVLDALHARGLIIWNFNLPLMTNSDRYLRRLLERIEPEHLREPALASLATFEQKRDAVARAAGRPEQLNLALADLEETFTQLTSVASTRAHGQTYAARTLVYEDCRRGIDVEIGPDVLASLGPPLSLLLLSARWVSHKIAEIYAKALDQVYDGMAREAGSPVVDAASFWLTVQPLVFSQTGERPVDELEPLLQDCWARVLSLPHGQRRVHYTTESLRQRAHEIFNAPQPGWTAARQHSPDLMIAAASAEAIRRGDYLLTIGELHLAVNTLGAASFMSQHSAPDDLRRGLEFDFPEPRILPVVSSSWPRATVRTSMALISPKDLLINFAHDSIAPDTCKALSIADLVVDRGPEGLVMRTRDGEIRFNALEAIGEALSTLAVNAMKILPPARHNPRITIDRLVICRESWSFQASDLEFAEEKDQARRFFAARRWAASHGLPRFTFVKVPSEIKPFYLDFDSPIYVDIFAKVVRQLAGDSAIQKPVTLSEMLPAPDQLWLPDAEGRLYTCEFRMVAIDLAKRNQP